MAMKLAEIYALGAKKYFEDQGVYRNPYRVNSPEFNEFERGWMQSLKRTSASLIQKDKIRPYSKDQ